MYRKNVASQFFCVQGVDATTGGIKSGVTWTVRRCIDGTFAAATGTATEDGTTGWYKFAMSQADTNGNDISFNFTGTGAVPQTVNILTTAADPSDTVRFGLTALPNAAAAASGGLWILGSNNTAAITIGALTTGAISGTTLTMSGAVAFQSTFAVTTSTSLGALSATTITASGAVAFQSTFAVTTSTSLGAISGSTVTFSGAVAFQSTFAVTTSTSLGALSATTITASGTTSLAAVTTSGTVTMNAFTVTNATTLTGIVTASNASNNIVGIDVAKFSGDAIAADNLELFFDGTGYNAANSTIGTVTLVTTTTTLTNLPAITAGWLTATGIAADAITAAKIADNAIDTATFAAGTTLPRVTLVDTLTTYTGNTVQTGDSFARIGATGSGLTSLAPSATALSTAVWTAPPTGFLATTFGATVGTSTLTSAQVLTTALTEAYATDGSTFTLSQGLYMIWSLLAERSIASTTLTAKKLDGSTSAMTFTLDSATVPTSQTRAS